MCKDSVQKWLRDLSEDMQCNVLIPEYPGYQLDFAQGITTTEQVRKQTYRVVTYLTNDLGFKHSDIVLAGYSIGSAVAADVAAWMGRRPPAALLLIAAFYSMPRAIGTMPLACKCLAHLISADHYHTNEDLEKIECPLMLMHGTRD